MPKPDEDDDTDIDETADFIDRAVDFLEVEYRTRPLDERLEIARRLLAALGLSPHALQGNALQDCRNSSLATGENANDQFKQNGRG